MPTTLSAPSPRAQDQMGPARMAWAAGAFCRGLLAILFLFVAIQTAQADIGPGPGPRPRPQPQPQLDEETTSTLNLKIDSTTTDARLRIPQQLLDQISVSRAEAEVPTSGLLSSGRTILAGLAMSLAVISLAFVLRSRRADRNRAIRSATGLAVVLAVAFCTLGVALADVSPPPRRHLSTPRLIIEAVDDGEELTLSLPYAMVPDLRRIIAQAEQEAAEPHTTAPDPLSDITSPDNAAPEVPAPPAKVEAPVAK